MVSVFRRPGFIISTIIVLFFLVLGYLGNINAISRMYVSNGTDLMYYIGIGLAMAIIMSYAGYVSFGQAVFVGIGSFSTGYVLVLMNRSNIISYLAKIGSGGRISNTMLAVYFTESLLLAITISVFIAVVVGYAVLRLRGAFFAISTIGLDYVVMYLVKYITKTRSPFGGEELLNPSMGLTDMTFYWMHFILFIITIYVAYFVKISKFGYGLAAIREDEDAAEIMGVNTFRYKIYAFALSGILASFWGIAEAFRKSYSIGYFKLDKSIIMLVENVVGGIGSFIGPIIGSIIYYLLEWSFLTTVGQWTLVILGATVVVVVAFFPEGIVGLLKKRFPRLRKWLE
ncbi:MAG: branched-chain amino acid ABC transporter permease [Desulfurococcales archaeon]|nr:branched-chain amino acid ABC transporter permease [Desulfurococcales archaeon]